MIRRNEGATATAAPAPFVFPVFESGIHPSDRKFNRAWRDREESGLPMVWWQKRGSRATIVIDLLPAARKFTPEFQRSVRQLFHESRARELWYGDDRISFGPMVNAEAQDVLKQLMRPLLQPEMTVRSPWSSRRDEEEFPWK
jgi:hypothetical protein